MITCPKCKSNEIDGVVFCSNCGTQLAFSDTVSTNQTITTDTKMPGRKTAETSKNAISMDLNNWISLHMVENGQILPLGQQDEFTLGRVSEGQSIMPDIDLTPYDAYANGVSRLHLVLKRGTDQATLVDLGSSNGTYLNSQRLEPNAEYTLTHGDILSLGNLKIQILINMQAKQRYP